MQRDQQRLSGVLEIMRYLESVEYSKSFPFVEKTIKATSASHKTEIS